MTKLTERELEHRRLIQLAKEQLEKSKELCAKWHRERRNLFEFNRVPRLEVIQSD